MRSAYALYQERCDRAGLVDFAELLLPLVLCIFPSIIMVILGPAAIQIVRTMLPLIGGQG